MAEKRLSLRQRVHVHAVGVQIENDMLRYLMRIFSHSKFQGSKWFLPVIECS
jgi:hypothetical protein